MMRSLVCRALGLAAVLVLLTSVASGPVGADAAPSGRVLVLAVPTLAWADLHTGRTPNLDRLVDDAAIAALSVRGVERRTDAGDGYASVSAGTRARGVPESGQVLEPDEDFFGVPAESVFRRNTGEVAQSGLVSLSFPAIVSRNNRLDYDAEIGALGQALADAEVPRAVIANADGRYALGAPTFDRAAGTALIDTSGVVPAGAVSGALIKEDPVAPFGVSYDQDAVLAAFDTAWTAGGVVLVESSDLVRTDRYRPLATSSQQQRLRSAALVRTDQLVGALLERVELAQDAVLVVAPYHSLAGVQTTVAALHAPGVEPGLLRSASTRRAGFVTLVDIAPTILDLAGVERPESMEGRRFERSERGSATGPRRAADLAAIDEAARHRDRMVPPVATVFIVLNAVLWVAAAVAFARGGPRARRVVGAAALAMLGYLPATYLAGMVDFWARSDLAYWAFVFGVAAIIAGLASLAGRRHPLDPLILALAAVFGLLVIDMLLGAPLQMNTVFGYSPTVGGRFAGMGNLAYGQFAGAAFLLCGLISRRLAGRPYAIPAALGVLVLAVIVDGFPMWGSDVGGVLAFVPAVGVTSARLLGHQIRWRSVVLWGGATALAIGIFAAVDLARPADTQTHLGRLVSSVFDQGWGSLSTVMTRKLGANTSVITSSVWTAMVPIFLAFIVYLLWRAPGQMRSIRDTIPESLPGLAVVGFLGFALNDSGIAVPGIMLGVVNASLVYLTVRTVPAPDDLPPDEPPSIPEAPGPAPVGHPVPV